MEYYFAIILVMSIIGAAIGMHTGLLALFVTIGIFFALTRWLKWRYVVLRLTPIVPIDHMFAAILLSALVGFTAKNLLFA